MSSWMNRRLVATQTWAVLWKAPSNSCAATASTSTSGSTMAASLPPSSRVMRLRSRAALSITRRPVAVEPVNEILAKPLWAVISGPRASSPLMTFSTPAGKTSRSSSPMRRVVRGVNGEGFTTMVLPASSAGPIFQIASSTGKFHGTMAQTTPSGTWCTSMRRVGLSSVTSTGMSSMVPAFSHMAAPLTSAIAPGRGRPCSCVNSAASSAALSSMICAAFSRRALRSATGAALQSLKARWAAATARSRSPASAAGAWAKTSPVAGLRTSIVATASTAWPSMVRV